MGKYYTAILVIFTLSLLTLAGNGQTKRIALAPGLHSGLPDSTNALIAGKLEALIESSWAKAIDTTLVDQEDYDFNLNFLIGLPSFTRPDSAHRHLQPRLVNIYPLGGACYALQLAYVGEGELAGLLSLYSCVNNGRVTFGSPLRYNTFGWKVQQVGTLTLHYRDTFNEARAALFHTKNTQMAERLALPVRRWEMYLSRNFQESRQLQGVTFEARWNGEVGRGDINDPRFLFPVMGNEDYTHDLLHIYAAEIRGRARNAIECGLAYLWTNVDYVDSAGHSPDLNELLPMFRRYLEAHPTDLLQLFEEDPPDRLLPYGAPMKTSVRQIMGGLIWERLYREKGTEGVRDLLRCGRGLDNLFKALDRLLGINRGNFDREVRGMLGA